MTIKKILQIKFDHLRNIDSWEKAVFEKIVKDNPKKFKSFYGFIKREVFTKNDGKIITEAYPINGRPTDEFKEMIKKAGLTGMTFGGLQ